MTRSHFKFLRRVRIHDGECGAVARALHHAAKFFSLPAASEKVSFATQERKVMSKATFFKRIAVSAIAALGLGMLSVAPSQATAGTPTVTATNGTASATLGAAETSTAARVSITGLTTTANDSYTVSVFRKSAPDSALADGAFHVVFLDTVTYSATRVDTDAQQAAFITASNAVDTESYDSKAVGTANVYHFDAGGAAGFAGAKFGVMVDSGTNRTGSEGAYVFTFVVTPISAGTAGTSVSTDVTLTINRSTAAQALINGTIDPSKTTAVLNAGTVADGSFTSTDATPAVVATADGTVHASLQVKTMTSASNPAPESVTVTITGAGLVRDAAAPSVAGKSIKIAGDGNDIFEIIADGTAGSATIVVSTTTVTFPAKTMTFFAVAPSTVTASVNKPVIAVGTNTDVVRAAFKDANGNAWGGNAYIVSADDAIAGDEDPVACTYNSTFQFHSCDIAGATKGTTTFTVFDATAAAVAADTVAAADATVTSTAQSVRVSTGVASSVVLSFDKATYAPGERAQLRVSVLDGEGLAMPGVTITNALAAGGITTASAFGSGSDTTTAVTFDLSGSTSATSNTNAGHKTYLVYMPATAGTITVSATGGTGIAASGRVAVTASAAVVDTSNDAAIEAASAASDAALEAIDAANAATDAANLAAEAADAATVAAEEARDAADAATAAVEALASEVATLMAALKAQITTLAKTVAKIAKKVKA